jgi:signal transduction histidine kinase
MRWRSPGLALWTVGRLLSVGFILAIATLMVVGISAFVQIRSLIQDQARVTQAALVEDQTRALLSSITDAETGQRGFLITGDSAYLAPYQESLKTIPQQLAVLGEQVSADRRQSAALKELAASLDSKLRELAMTVQLRRDKGFAAAQAVVVSNRGAVDMASIRRLDSEMLQQQRAVLARRLAASAASGDKSLHTIAGAGILGVLLIGCAATWVTRKILRPVRHVTAVATQIIAGDLGISAPVEGPREVAVMATAVNAALEAVGQLNSALQGSERRILLLNDGLERRVHERTDELEVANSELDAFTYSVAHDLRTPLRSLHGYSQLIQERCIDGLDVTAQNYFRRIQANTEQMELLIDDLLKLSHTSRVELCMVRIDLSQMAHEILRELATNEPERTVDIRIESDLAASGDAHLLHMMLYQLLANSWKFTATRDHALIEVGRRVGGGRTTFFVRDNGVGFDPRYAGKLFTPFQRLHDVLDFAGTGIGLAIAQRVVGRHGGRVWATSIPDQGAEFFFTLEPLNDPGDENSADGN